MGATIDLGKLVQDQLTNFSQVNENTTQIDNNTPNDNDALIANALSISEQDKSVGERIKGAAEYYGQKAKDTAAIAVAKGKEYAHKAGEKAHEYAEKGSEHMGKHWPKYAGAAALLGGGAAAYKYMKSRKK